MPTKSMCVCLSYVALKANIITYWSIVSIFVGLPMAAIQEINYYHKVWGNAWGQVLSSIQINTPGINVRVSLYIGLPLSAIQRDQGLADLPPGAQATIRISLATIQVTTPNTPCGYRCRTNMSAIHVAIIMRPVWTSI